MADCKDFQSRRKGCPLLHSQLRCPCCGHSNRHWTVVRFHTTLDLEAMVEESLPERTRCSSDFEAGGLVRSMLDCTP